MRKERTDDEWIAEFGIHSAADLDFVIGQNVGFPIGMTRHAPPEFRRRVAAAGISYQLQLRSMDYALKKYVNPHAYENEQISIGDAASDFLRDSAIALRAELKKLHTRGDLTFGQLGMELTLFKFPETLDLARMLSNRGLFLEVLPLLRLCIEMSSWAVVALRLNDDEEAVAKLKAQRCIAKLKSAYKSAGHLYGFLSKFAHCTSVTSASRLYARRARNAQNRCCFVSWCSTFSSKPFGTFIPTEPTR